jgi:hypothetical protein
MTTTCRVSIKPEDCDGAWALPQLQTLTVSPTNSRQILVLAGLMIVIGLILRAHAAMGDFWFDEVISLNFALHAKAAVDLIGFRSDNNHLLNTWLMRAMGTQAYWPIYRVPAVLAGGVSIALAGAIARRWGRAPCIVAMLVVATSYPLVHYGSEARGYSLAVMFMLGAVWAQDRLLGAHRPAPDSVNARCGLVATLWVCCMLGMLAHPLFLQPYLALLGWAAWAVRLDRSGRCHSRWRGLLAWHVAPAAFAIVMYFAHWRGMEVAGGAINPPVHVIGRSVALLIGWPHEAMRITVVGVMIAGTIVISALTWLGKRRDDFIILGLLAVFAVPALMLLILRPVVLYERYFLLPMTCALVVIAGWLGAAIAKRGPVRALAALAIVMLAGLNLWRDYQLMTVGRGQYLAGLEFMADNTRSESIVVGSDHDPRTLTLLEFYGKYLAGRPLKYVPADRWPADAEWFIVQGRDQAAVPREHTVDRFGLHWRLSFKTNSVDLSGWRWFIYQRVQDR